MVSVDKDENHGLKMHFKSFQAFLKILLFTNPPLDKIRGVGLINLTRKQKLFSIIGFSWLILSNRS